jgi:hypothetical protein
MAGAVRLTITYVTDRAESKFINRFRPLAGHPLQPQIAPRNGGNCPENDGDRRMTGIQEV